MSFGIDGEIKSNIDRKDVVICLIDSDIIIYRVVCLFEEEEDFGLVAYELNRYIKMILNNVSATHYIGFLTGTNNFRKDITKDSSLVKEYKGNRPSTRPKWWQVAREYLVNRYNIYIVDNIEADDAISITNSYYKDQEVDIVIASSDKDLLQIPGRHYNFAKHIWIEVDDDEATYKFWLSMITGDNSDNIGGIPKYGQKKAEKLLNGIESFDMQDVVAMKYEEVFGENHEEIFNINYNLLKLLEEPKFGFEIIDPKPYGNIIVKDEPKISINFEDDAA